MNQWLPTVSGGTVDTWEISPSFTNGLSFNPSLGWITGTPTSLQTTAVTYTVWANNSGGSISTTINITSHQKVYKILGKDMGSRIHAFSMKTFTPKEFNQN